MEVYFLNATPKIFQEVHIPITICLEKSPSLKTNQFFLWSSRVQIDVGSNKL